MTSLPVQKFTAAEFRSGRSALRTLLFAAVALAGYSIFLTFQTADFAESNFQGNLARIQKYLFGRHPDVVLVGSSISGRLLPRYFSQSGLSVANLGMDGSGVDFAMQIARQRRDRPSTLLIETNSFFRKPNVNDLTLQKAVKDFSFRAARYFPPMRSASRPSSFLYSLLKERSDRREGQTTPPTLSKEAARSASVSEMPPLDRVSENQLRAIVEEFANVHFVRIPTGGDVIPRPADQIDRLAQEIGISQIDLVQGHLQLTFTDGLHLNSASAQAVSGLIAQQLKDRALAKP